MTTVRDLLFDNPAEAVGTLTHELETTRVLTSDLVPAGDAAIGIVDLLDSPVGNLIASAWAEFAAVQKACAETRDAPGSRQEVRVGRHTIQSTQHPRLEAEIDNRSIPLLTLELVVSLTMDAVVVTVAAGQVVTIALGEATGEIKLSCGDVTLAEHTVTRVVLPDVIDVGNAQRARGRELLPASCSACCRPPR
jgi:hypothetical protein